MFLQAHLSVVKHLQKRHVSIKVQTETLANRYTRSVNCAGIRHNKAEQLDSRTKDMSKHPSDSNASAGTARLDALVVKARKEQDDRNKGYRELSLKMHPWVCGKCGREFTRETLHLLTVHHKDHNHDNNPADGSNWENLCIYCHDNEHSRYGDHIAQEQAGTRVMDAHDTRSADSPATHSPFANLKDLLKTK